MFNLSPKEDKFYDLFVSNAEIINESAKMLTTFVNDLSNSEEKVKGIKEMEHKGDKKVHEILKELNKTFITPFDREDIYMIAKEMDNIEDYIESTASRFVMFNVKEAKDEAKLLCNLIEECTETIIIIMKEFKMMSRSGLILENIIKVNKLEEDGDFITRNAIKDLFCDKEDVLDVIKWREIYQHFEETLDACEDVANLVEGVVMKNA